ncbi:hypothetical protein [Streptomyces platensis]|uniref:hypothetical protein n=1 Tax=Streptomyces platensis TaxID=58346 RepID=UPI0037B938A4
MTNASSAPATEAQLPHPPFGTTIVTHDVATFRTHRIFNLIIKDTNINRDSTVFVSLTEVHGVNPEFGTATVKLYNVTPCNGEVLVRVEIDWNTDIDMEARYIALNRFK